MEHKDFIELLKRHKHEQCHIGGGWFKADEIGIIQKYIDFVIDDLFHSGSKLTGKYVTLDHLLNEKCPVCDLKINKSLVVDETHNNILLENGMWFPRKSIEKIYDEK
jgi:hypothetical protein